MNEPMKFHEMLQNIREAINPPANLSERGQATQVMLRATKLLEAYDRGAFLIVERDNLKPMPRMKFGGFCGAIKSSTGERCGIAVKEGDAGYLFYGKDTFTICSRCGNQLAKKFGLFPYYDDL